MKKTIILSLLVIGGYASASVSPKNNEVIKKTGKTKAKIKKPVCTVSCSATVNVLGTMVTVTTSAGGWFTSCDTAAANCTEKLGKKMMSIALN